MQLATLLYAILPLIPASPIKIVFEDNRVGRIGIAFSITPTSKKGELIVGGVHLKIQWQMMHKT